MTVHPNPFVLKGTAANCHRKRSLFLRLGLECGLMTSHYSTAISEIAVLCFIQFILYLLAKPTVSA